MTIAEVAAKAGTDAATVVRVLQAVREPSDAMILACPSSSSHTFIAKRWRAMVDALLRTAGETPDP